MGKVMVGLLVITLLLLSQYGCSGQTEQEYAIHVYTRSDACGAAETWANYLGDYHQEDLMYIAVYGDPGLAEAVRRDPLGIGYNNLNYAYDMQTGEPVAGLRVIPIDLNGNGRIDSDEGFYDTKAQLIEAVAAGRYPSPPARALHIVTKDEFTGITREFARWILTEGQQYVGEVGYVTLAQQQVEEGLSKLGNGAYETDLEGEITISGAWALYPMMITWAEEFEKLHPAVDFHISAGGAGKGMVDALGGLVDIGMVSREIYPAEIEKGAFWVSVTKDAVVPMMNDSNPLIEEILAKGINRQTCAGIWVTGEVTDWRSLAE